MPKSRKKTQYPQPREQINPLDGLVLEEDGLVTTEPPAAFAAWRLTPFFRDNAHGIWLYQGNCLAVLDAIVAKYPDGCFDCIFADPPYFLSNGGITCHAGCMVRVDKGDWDKSRGWEWNHEFNRAWLERCQRALKPNGTLWVTGTHHVIFSVGFAMQQLGFKILNDIAWEKPNPPPNLSCRYFTHSTETLLWAAKNEKSKHRFNYVEMKRVTGKQMKTVWRKEEFAAQESEISAQKSKSQIHSADLCASTSDLWTIPAPGRDEKTFGKHPTQKPVALVARCLLASTAEGDLVLDPFLGVGTTAVAAARLRRRCVGIELELAYLQIAAKRVDNAVIELWLREFHVNMDVAVFSQNNLDLFSSLIDRSALMSDKPAIQAERIYHETKFVFLSCAHVREASVVHTTISVDLQEAWSQSPSSARRVTTHIVRCETEILRLKSG